MRQARWSAPLSSAVSLMLLVACGPGGGVAPFRIVNAGTGDAVVTQVNRVVGTRLTYGLMTDGKLTPLGDAVYTRRITLTNGPEVVVYSTPDEDVYIQMTNDGEYTWGGNTDLAESPVLSLKLPLKQDLEWETYDAKGTPFYHYKVEAIERVDVPAGTFTTARVIQLNLRQSTTVTRWYAQDVGMVQRNNSILLRYELVKETP